MVVLYIEHNGRSLSPKEGKCDQADWVGEMIFSPLFIASCKNNGAANLQGCQGPSRQHKGMSSTT